MGRPRKNPLAPVAPAVESTQSDGSPSQEPILQLAKPELESPKSLLIKSKKASFWRCRREFTLQPKLFSVSDFSASEIAILKAEPNLEVREA